VRLHAFNLPRQLTYGIHNPTDITATNIHHAADLMKFEIIVTPSPGHRVTVSSALVGEFNIYNMLAAASVAHALGIELEVIKRGLEKVEAIDGRMQRIHRGQPFPVIVDFAHTPNALAKALAAARTMLNQSSIINRQSSIIVVFGSAGKRDVEKRRLMAEIGARDADRVILTAEDPRTESLDDILAMMADGARSQGSVEGQTFWRVPDRGEAIYFALTLARPQDLVLICGKGHEQSMCFGTIEYPWDDREATRAALDAFLQGQPMPYLGLPTFKP
jgi:UDP-N-acetylmuramoyl-L-alanyl-D-glutamate--2,6-diaminopimelate ligase